MCIYVHLLTCNLIYSPQIYRVDHYIHDDDDDDIRKLFHLCKCVKQYRETKQYLHIKNSRDFCPLLKFTPYESFFHVMPPVWIFYE